MRTTSRRAALVLSCAGAAVLALACNDSTGPGGPRHPIVGVYDITTSLQTYEYPTGTTMPYTHDTTTAGDAQLSGALTIGDSIVVTPGAVELPLYQASMKESRVAGTTTSVDYTTPYVPLRVAGDSVQGYLASPYENLGLKGTFAGDSIVGRIEWQAYRGPAYQTYSGTFVARRRR